MPGDPLDTHSRYIEAAVNGVLTGCLYLPNGNPQPGPEFDFKLRWLDRFAQRAADLLHQDFPVLLAGDTNIIPADLDVYNPSRWVDDALFHPQVRIAFRRLIDDGWTDAIRFLNPHDPIYTFWFSWAWERDMGLRIDHFLLTTEAAKRLENAGVERMERGRPRASDHAPAWIDLADDWIGDMT